MPIYEYRCPSCEEQTEVLQQVGEEGDDLTCPYCEHTGLEREVSTFSATGFTGAFGGFNAPSCTGFT